MFIIYREDEIGTTYLEECFLNSGRYTYTEEPKLAKKFLRWNKAKRVLQHYNRNGNCWKIKKEEL